MNCDKERLQGGNVILVIDEVSKEVKQYLVDMKIQSISKDEAIKRTDSFDEPEDRQKVLRIVLRIIDEEFRRGYSSRIA